MLRLLSILSRYRNLLLWLVLQSFALFLIVRYNDHQRHIFGNIMLEASGKMHKQRYQYSKFVNLPQKNDSLVSRNKYLQEENDSLRQQVLALRGMVAKDTLRNPGLAPGMETPKGFNLIPCRAIRTTLDKSYNYIYLDKGSKDGVYEGMGVISPQGIAGRVIRVSKNYSLALSALNLSFKLSAKIEGLDFVGLYGWEPTNKQFGYLSFIPIDAELKENMRVVTSNVSTVFPAGYLVGTIGQDDQKLEGTYYRLRIKLATNFENLGNLYLLEARNREEIESLAKDLSQE